MKVELLSNTGKKRKIHPAYARVLVKQGQATVICKFPYRIQLLH